MASAEPAPVPTPTPTTVDPAPAVTAAVPLSKRKSRYVPPHMRADKQNVIVVNPDDEMPPPQKQRAPSSAYPHGQHHGQHPPPMYPNYPPPMHNGNGNHSPHLPPSSPPRGGPRDRPPSKSSPKEHNADWRTAPKRSQPDLNADQLLAQTQNIPANSTRRYDSRRRGGGGGGGNRGRGRGRGGGGGDRGPPRYHPNGPGPMGPPPPDYYYGPPPDHPHGGGDMGYGRTSTPPLDGDGHDEEMDPNQLMFAKIDEAEQGGGGGFDSPFNGPGPGPAQPMDWAELNEQEMGQGGQGGQPPSMATLPRMQPPPPHIREQNRNTHKQRRGPPPSDREPQRRPRGDRNERRPRQERRDRERNREVPRDGREEDGYGKKGGRSGDRYSRQYSSPKGGSRGGGGGGRMGMGGDMNLTPEQRDMTQYELSGDFQSLSVGKGQRGTARGRRRHRNDRVPPPHHNSNANTILDTLNDAQCASNGKGKQEKEETEREREAEPLSKTSVVVPRKSKPAPTNWAQAQKPKGNANAKAKATSSVNASGFLTGYKPRARGVPKPKKVTERVLDADRVCHVLEVLNMSAGDHQSVSVLFRSFEMHFQTLMSVSGRWFVCLDDERAATKALSVVKDESGRFQLRRIDCNARDVQMLKNNVPPPNKHQYM